ncbi:MAG: hypothetical protein ACJ0DM_03890 [Gammaproteobacteria bacterium]
MILSRQTLSFRSIILRTRQRFICLKIMSEEEVEIDFDGTLLWSKLFNED